MIDLYQYTLEKIYEYVPGPKDRSPNELNFRCFYCGDSKKSKFKKRAHIYRGHDNSVSFFCWNCRRSARGYKLIADITGGTVKDVMKEILYANRGMNNQELIKQVYKSNTTSSTTSAKVEELPKNEEINLKNSWVDLEKNEDAVKIVKQRLINKAPFLPKHWKLYFDTETNRIVIPWYKNNKLVYYQLRKIYGNSDRKYMFPTKQEIMNKGLYGLDNIDDSFPYIFFTEGVFDAIFVKNCIAVGGLLPTSHQKKLLEPYMFGKQLVIFPDNPWLDKSSKDNLIKLADKRSDILVYMWKKNCKSKDINDVVVKAKDPNVFADLEMLKSRIVTIDKCKLMLRFNKDIFIK